MGSTNRIDLRAVGVALKAALGEENTPFFENYGLKGNIEVSQNTPGDGEVEIPYQVLAGTSRIPGLLRFRENGEILDGIRTLDPLGAMPRIIEIPGIPPPDGVRPWQPPHPRLPTVNGVRLLIQLTFGPAEFSGSKPTDYEAKLFAGAAGLYQCLAKNNNDTNHCDKEIASITEIKNAEEKVQNDKMIVQYESETQDLLEFARAMLVWAKKEDEGPFGVDPNDIRPTILQYQGSIATYFKNTKEDALARLALAKEMVEEVVKEDDTGFPACLSLGRCKQTLVSRVNCVSGEGSIGNYNRTYNGTYLKTVSEGSCTEKGREYGVSKWWK